MSRWLLLVWLTLPLTPTCASSGQPRLAKHFIPYRWQCHGLLTIPGKQLPKQLLPCKSLEQVWPTCLLPPGSARTGYPFQLPVVHSCQSNKGCVLQRVVQSTALGHSTSINTLAASRREEQKIKPITLVIATQPKVLGTQKWRRNSLLGEFPSHHLPPGKHRGTDRQGRRSWQLASTEKP